MHKTVLVTDDGGLRLYERDLSLPTKDLLGARGFSALSQTDIGCVISMAKPAGELHYLFTMNTLHRDASTGELSFVAPSELADEASLVSLLDQGDLLGIDHAFDAHSLLDTPVSGKHVVARCDADLRHVIGQLLDAEHKPFAYDSVLVISNAGLGYSTTLASQKDGVIRDAEGFGIGTRLHGEEKQQYQRGLFGSYQNTGKNHFHIVPIPSDVKDTLMQQYGAVLRGMHAESHTASLAEYKQSYSPSVGVISIAHVERVDAPLVFEHFSHGSLADAQKHTAMSSFAGDLLREQYGRLRSLDFSDKAKLAEIRENSAAYFRDVVSK